MHRFALTAGSAAIMIATVASTPLAAQTDRARWERTARQVTIIRDDWGVPHVYGRSDADAVFGLMYAQAEDDFSRIETNYLTSLGRMAEAEGEARVWQDLRMRLFVDHDSLRAMYRRSPAWLRRLMDAWADGLNWYLATHPDVRPRVITRFEPWMALSFTEGSIGGDIERIRLDMLERFYQDSATAPAGAPSPPPGANEPPSEPTGSNGIAIAPSLTATGHAMLLINPHTSFFFREEAQTVSEEGLNAYGALTWGQFFIYQGFTDRIGWMHTSSGVDNIDEYLVTVTRQGDRLFYRHGDSERPLAVSTIRVAYRTPSGVRERRFTVYRTHHGPIVRRAPSGQWVSVSLMYSPIAALTQSYTRTKARSLREFRSIMELHTNSSNNTLYADADGNIAYFHSNFIPRRDTAFDWARPVDGGNPATDWRGVLSFDESPNVVNPATGWAYNSNDAPWWASGTASPRRENFPAYVETGGWSARGRHAVRILERAGGWTLDSLVAAAFDGYLPWFERTVPALVRAWDGLPAGDTLRARLEEPIGALRVWDTRWASSSVPTSLAVFWGTELNRRLGSQARAARVSGEEYAATRANPRDLLAALAAACDTLTAGFGTWRTPWGDINRFQRLTGDIVQPFSDAAPSTPVGFTSGTWGSLASFGARAYPGTRRWYGTSGNSFVAVVEFGDSVRARAVTAGGLDSRPASRHFNDQAERYATGSLREVYFYRSQLPGHTEREYHPGN